MGDRIIARDHIDCVVGNPELSFTASSVNCLGGNPEVSFVTR